MLRGVSIALRIETYPAFPEAPPLWVLAVTAAAALVAGLLLAAWAARRAARLEPATAFSKR